MLRNYNIILDQAYNIHKRIFKGVSFNEFKETVNNNKAIYNKIKLFKNNKNIFGYVGFHVFENNKIIILRSEGGFLPQYRKQSSQFVMFLIESIKALLKFKSRPIYFFANPISPMGYHFLHKYYKEIYPSPFHKTPLSIKKALNKILLFFYPNTTVNSNNTVAKTILTNWRVIATPDNIRFPRNAITDFYLKENPKFKLGYGLIVLVPINYRTVLNFFLETIKKKFRRGIHH